VELLDFEEPTDTIPKKLEAAEASKAVGNEAFKKGESGPALEAYAKVELSV